MITHSLLALATCAPTAPAGMALMATPQRR